MINNDPLFSSLSNAWYPVALSRQVKPGQHRAIRLFDTHWLLFRSRSGRLGMTSRYCCHLGTDISNGRVVDDHIECPLHGWRFDTDGYCRSIPALNSVPANIRLSSLQLEERFGIVFAFYGEKPLFEFPRPPEMSPDPDFSAPIVVPLQAPYHVAALNTFDIQHYDIVHARRFVSRPVISEPSPYCLRIDYTAEIIRRRWIDRMMARISGNTTSVSIESWGGGLLMLKNRDTCYGSIVGMYPRSETACDLFIVALRDRERNQPWSGKITGFLALRLAALFLKSYLSPDRHIIANMRSHQGALLEDVDDGLRSFFDYWRALPKVPVYQCGKRKRVA